MVSGGDEILHSIPDHPRRDELFDPLLPHDMLLLAAWLHLLSAFSRQVTYPLTTDTKEKAGSKKTRPSLCASLPALLEGRRLKALLSLYTAVA
jgi:hypothetical protein